MPCLRPCLKVAMPKKKKFCAKNGIMYSEIVMEFMFRWNGNYRFCYQSSLHVSEQRHYCKNPVCIRSI